MGTGGGARGGRARLEWDQMPRNVLRSKACGEQSEDFCAAVRHKSNGILRLSKKSGPDFFDSLSKTPVGNGGSFAC